MNSQSYNFCKKNVESNFCFEFPAALLIVLFWLVAVWSCSAYCVSLSFFIPFPPFAYIPAHYVASCIHQIFSKNKLFPIQIIICVYWFRRILLTCWMLPFTNFNVSVYIIRCVSACVCVQSALAVKNRTKFYKNTIWKEMSFGLKSMNENIRQITQWMP